MAQPKINVAVQGSGMSANTFHLPILSALSNDFHIHSVIARSPKPLAKFPNIPVITFEDALKDSNIHLIVITGPNSCHFPYASAALKAGKHVVVEKPFTPNSQQALELAKLVQETGLFLAVYHNRRFDADFKTVQKLIREKTLGDVVEFESNYDRFRPNPKGGWREDAQEEGSGILFDLGSHLVDQALHLFGLPTSVTGIVQNQRGIETDDFFIITLHYAQRPTLVTLRSGCFYARPRPRFLVHGTKGAFTKVGLDVQEDQLKAGRFPGDSANPPFGAEPESQWGEVSDGVSPGAVKVPSEVGTYVDFYRGVALGVRGNSGGKDRAEQVGLVSAKAGGLVVYILELARKSSVEGKTLPVQFTL